MKILRSYCLSRPVSQTLFFLFIFVSFLANRAYGGFTLEMDVIRFAQYGYYFSPNLMTNNTAPAVPFGDYSIMSFGYPTNGSYSHYHFDTNGFNQTGGNVYGYGDYDGMVHEITNGMWIIYATNSVTTNVYQFTVTVNCSSNDLPYVNVTYPTNGATGVPNQVNFTWQGGPTNYSDLIVYQGNNNSYLPVTQTNWQGPVMLDGLNSFTPHYDSNSTTAAVSSIPLDSHSQPISSWVSTAHLQDYSQSQFTVGVPDTSGTAHTLVAHYPYYATNGTALGAAQDTSGNGYDMSFGGGYGAQGGVNVTSDAAAGVGALQFNDGDGSSAGYLGWSEPTPPALLSALAGSFTVSCWVKTTQNIAWNTALAYYGAGIVSADNSGLYNDTIPIALTGGSIAFNTGGNEDDTLNSVASINDGNYHFVVVTRNQQTGQKIIYIDGQFDSFSSGTTNLLNDPQKLTIGALANAGNPNPNDGSYYNGYNGELDDLQIYSGALSATEVAGLYASPGSTAPNGGGSGPGGHTGVAHLTFDNSGYLGQDSSGHNNNLDGVSYWGPQQSFSSDAETGGGAVQFYGTSCMTPNSQVQANIDAVLGGSFTFSAWVNTTASVGNDTDNAYFGATIFWAFNDHNSTNDTIPLSITGSKAAFTTRDHLGNFTTIHSVTSVNDGNYHLVTVTRNQASGEMRIYVDGNFEASTTGTTDPLNGNNYFLSLGGTTESSYSGLLDDFQIYSGVLSDGEVAELYNNPGEMIPDVSGSSADFNAALGTTNLNWSTSGDTSWFAESTNTYNGAAEAAQSGPVTNNQSSTLSVTVTGPGLLNFYWASQDDCNNFDYQFALDGNKQSDITCSQSWTQYGPFLVPAGQHTLSWTTYAYGDVDPTEAGFLDDVSYTQETVPVITLNPFSQTNYPGYSVWLDAAVATNANISWQWYKVGAGAISGATSSYYIPTNSGTPGVSGQYYAIASNDAGSAITTTASVTFVTAASPPGWTTAFKSPFQAVDDTQVTRDYYFGCITDTNGNIYTAAEFGGNMQIGSQDFDSGPGGDAAAVVKQTPGHSALWAAAITNNGNGSSYAYCVAPGPAGGVYVAGNFNGTNWLGTNSLIDHGNGDIFLASFDASGSNLWLRTFGGTNSDFIILNSLTADSAGNVTLAGLLGNGPVTIGASNLLVSGQQGTIVQFDSTGAVRWAQELPDWPQYIVCDAGRLYASVNTFSSANATNAVIGGVTNITDRSWAVACLNDTNGQAIWVRGVGAQYGSGNGNPYSAGVIDDVPRLAVSGTNLFMTGVAYSTNATFGSLTVNFGDLRGQYVARYDTDGNAIVASTYGSVTTTPNCATADAKGELYVAGVFDGYSDFGNDQLAAPVGTRHYNGDFSQAFIAKFDINGNPLWANDAVSSDFVNFFGIALATNGVWASGWGQSGYYPQPEYIQFGTNDIFSDAQFVS
ncbi:MAG TPA: LamG domain-containing protein, partial [Verrucomicrobiae bacterium]|nr:LamG domain-containing protein [Verrucomicrobiae bacterium]